jgi:hypothetical protein
MASARAFTIQARMAGPIKIKPGRESGEPPDTLSISEVLKLLIILILILSFLYSHYIKIFINAHRDEVIF